MSEQAGVSVPSEMKKLLFILDLPFRFVYALVGFTFMGWIGRAGLVLIALKFFGVIPWPWWVAALPLIYGVLYCLYMTIDAALYRAGMKGVGGYAQFTQAPLVAQAAQIDQAKIQEIISGGPERIGATIDAWCDDPNHRRMAQAVLDAALEPYFLLQLAMFANKKLNANVTIKKWRDAGLKLPAEGTPEFYPYGDPQKAAPPQQAQQFAGVGVPQDELDREVGIKPDELLGLSQICLQINSGINLWLNPPSGVSPTTRQDVYENLRPQLPKVLSGLNALQDRIQEIWDRGLFDYKMTDHLKISADEVRVKCSDLLSLAEARGQISNELNQWLHPEEVVLKEGTDTFGHLLDRLSVFATARRSMAATFNGITERNFGKTSK
jgi:hypothetical protein